MRHCQRGKRRGLGSQHTWPQRYLEKAGDSGILVFAGAESTLRTDNKAQFGRRRFDTGQRRCSVRPQDQLSAVAGLLRAAATARPAADVEEQLLLRLRDEVANARELHVTSTAATDIDVVELTPTTSERERRRGPLLAIAASVAVIVGVVAIATRPDPTTETNPVTVPEPATTTDELDAACRRHLPELTAVDSSDYPTGFGATEAQREWVTLIRDAVAGISDAAAGDERPEVVLVRMQLTDFIDQLDELAIATADRNRGELAGSAEVIARRAVLLLADLEPLGAASCAQPNE